MIIYNCKSRDRRKEEVLSIGNKLISNNSFNCLYFISLVNHDSNNPIEF